MVVVCLLITTTTTEALKCSGLIDISIVDENAKVHIQVEGIDLVTANPVGTPSSAKLPLPTREDYAGQNYVTVDEHHIQLFPAGKLGLNRLYSFNLTTKTWDSINVSCPPLGVAYVPSRDAISGFCAVNTSVPCVPYFTLALQGGKWTEMQTTPFGYYCIMLSSINLTDPIILQNYNSEYEANVVMLYFAERGTNKLYEVNLHEYQADSGVCYLPRYRSHSLEIEHLVPAIAGNGSFHGLRIESLIDDFSGIYQTLAYSNGEELIFSDKTINTASVAFNSYNLDYLVTFANNQTIVIISQEGTAKQFPLNSALDDPIHCQNMAIGPSTHYLICLAGKGAALLISINDNVVTSQIIPSGKSSIVSMGWLTNHTFYLLNKQLEMMFFLFDSGPLLLGDYVVSSTNIRVVGSNGTITCSDVMATAKQNDVATIIGSVSATIFLISFISVILIFLWWWKRKRSKKYEMMSNDSECSSNNLPVDQTDEEEMAVVVNEPLRNQGDNQISHEANNGNDGNCMPLVRTDISNQNNSSPVSNSFDVTTTAKQCTNDDSEPSLPSMCRLPPDGSQRN